MTDRFGILSCRIPSTALALSLAASLIWIPQSLILADTVAAVCIGTEAELTGLSPIVLASMFALLLVARSVADTGAFSISARTSTAKKLDLRRKLIQAVLPWSPFDATRPPAGEIASLAVDQVETIDPFLVRYQIARFRVAVVPVAILVAILPVSWAVALMLAIAGPVIPVFMALIGPTARERSRRQLNEAGHRRGYRPGNGGRSACGGAGRGGAQAYPRHPYRPGARQRGATGSGESSVTRRRSVAVRQSSSSLRQLS